MAAGGGGRIDNLGLHLVNILDEFNNKHFSKYICCFNFTKALLKLKETFYDEKDDIINFAKNINQLDKTYE